MRVHMCLPFSYMSVIVILLTLGQLRHKHSHSLLTHASHTQHTHTHTHTAALIGSAQYHELPLEWDNPYDDGHGVELAEFRRAGL